MSHIFTGNYFECKAGNLISISKDEGRDAGFRGKSMLEFAPKKEFFKKWRENIGKIPEKENNLYYIKEYYKQVLSKIDIKDLLKNEKNPVLLCYELDQSFCHRHVLAEYIELIYDEIVMDIKIDEKLRISENKRPAYIKQMLGRVIIENELIPDSEKMDLNKNKELIFKIIPELKEEDGFDQKNKWHSYDVWEHTLVALNNSDADLETRMALLLHDVGKPSSCQEENGVRHFKGHAEKSAQMAYNILKRLGYSEAEIGRICYFIRNHSTYINIENLDENNIEMVKKLLKIQYCDASGYSQKYSEIATKKLDEIKEKIDKKEKELINEER